MFTRQKLADVAEHEAGLKLVWKPGSAAEKYKEPFFKIFGKGKWSWCAAFVRWCCFTAGLDIPIKIPANMTKFGYTFALVEGFQQWAIFMGFYHDNDGIFEPQRGDISCFDWDQANINDPDKDWENHIGVHIRKEGKNFVCAEGNASNMTNMKVRKPVQIQGWIRIPDGFTFSGGVSTGEQPAPIPAPVGARVLREGSIGADVGAAQTRLNALGANLVVDNAFGPKMKIEVMTFQRSNGLTPDGIIGNATRAKLFGGSQPAPTPVPTPVPNPSPILSRPMGSAPLRLAPRGPTIRGMDISNYQPKVNYAACKAAGIEFCWAKATEGTTVYHKTYTTHRDGCRAAGILFGGYHFFRSTTSVEKQLAHFLSKLGNVLPTDLPPMLDVEQANSAAPAKMVEMVREFCEGIERETGRRPVIYTGPSFWKDHLGKGASGFEKYPLWIAHYHALNNVSNIVNPLTPPPWANWDIHQFTSRGPIPGHGTGDLNRFNGTLAEFRAKFLV